MTLPVLPAEFIEDVARGLDIVQLEGGGTSKWIVNDEQRIIWRKGERHARRFILKSRRRGASTALRLEGMLNTMAADAAGHRMRYGIAIHVEDKLTEQFVLMGGGSNATAEAKAKSWLGQMAKSEWWFGDIARRSRCMDSYIGLPGGSEIFGITAGASGATRSEGAQRMDYEEYSFYKDGALGEMSPSVSLGTMETICTTIDIGKPNGVRARDVWRGNNDWEKIFFPFEMAREYVADPSSITDAEWEWCLKQGFNPERRDSGAFWIWLLKNKLEDDEMRLFREYPPTPDHAFIASASRWVKITSRIVPPVDVWNVQGFGREVWPVLVWKKPEQTSGRICITCDAAKGSGISRATVCAIDEDDGRLVALMADPLIMGDDQARVAFEVYTRYSRELTRTTGDKEWQRPRMLVEDNSMGQVLIQPLRRIGVPFATFDTDHGMQLLGMQLAKQAIESGLLEGPKELAEECDECTRDPLTGKFKGHKDVMMSYGFWAARARPQDRTPKKDTRIEHRIDGKALARAAMRTERRMGRR